MPIGSFELGSPSLCISFEWNILTGDFAGGTTDEGLPENYITVNITHYSNHRDGQSEKPKLDDCLETELERERNVLHGTQLTPQNLRIFPFFMLSFLPSSIPASMQWRSTNFLKKITGSKPVKFHPPVEISFPVVGSGRPESRNRHQHHHL